MCNVEEWRDIYQKALIELEHARMRGRTGDAREKIIRQIESLKSIPGLHEPERRSIADALNALDLLEQVSDRYNDNQRRRVLERVAREIQYLAPTIHALKKSA